MPPSLIKHFKQSLQKRSNWIKRCQLSENWKSYKIWFYICNNGFLWPPLELSVCLEDKRFLFHIFESVFFFLIFIFESVTTSQVNFGASKRLLKVKPISLNVFDVYSHFFKFSLSELLNFWWLFLLLKLDGEY